jgi:large subunit ribosomal protein L14
MKKFQIIIIIIMIQVSTNLKVIDNSGAKLARCIKVLGGFKTNKALIGDLIVVSIKKIKTKRKVKLKVKKGDVSRALVIRTVKEYNRLDGSSFKFKDNAIILLDKNHKPLGTRVSGAVIEELRRRKLMKILTISSKLF